MNDEVNSMAFSPGGRVMAARKVDRTVTLSDVESRKQIAKLDGRQARPFSLAFTALMEKHLFQVVVPEIAMPSCLPLIQLVVDKRPKAGSFRNGFSSV